VVLSEARERVRELGWQPRRDDFERVEACNLCGGCVFATITHADRYGFPVSSAACTTCGLVFLDPRPSADSYEIFYRDAYRPLVSAFHGRTIDAASVEEDQAYYAAELARLLEPFLAERRGGTVLDVGGSTGVVAEAIAAVNELRGTVLDPSPAELERAAARGLRTVAGTIESFDPGNEVYDVILFCQTLDHVLDASGALAKLRGVLADDGILFVDVVDFRAAYLRAWDAEAATKVDHPYSFTEDTAESLLARAGLDLVRKAYARDRVHVGYVCRPGRPVDGLPDATFVRELFRELRLVQNAAR
jgi:2-polyprenyl-3-methyl-5-hydroxy-6-metoxy-1,4-benzoquinol methylase